MKRRVLVSIILITGLIFIANKAFSAWTQPKNNAYNQLTLSYYKTTQKYTSMNVDHIGVVQDPNTGIELKDTEEFTSTKLTYYSEYGVTDNFTVFLTIPYDWQRSNDTMKYAGEDGPSGIGDINLGFRKKLVDNIMGSGVLMSLQAEVKIPEAYDYDHPLENLSLGSGQYDARLSFLFGRGFGKGYGWINAGYKWRFENDEWDPLTFKPSDEFKLSIGGGYAVLSWLSIRGLVDWTKSVGNADVSNELIWENWTNYGGFRKDRDIVLIKDTLGLEPDALSVGIDLAFNISKVATFLKDTFPHKEIVVSYNTEISGWDKFRTKDFSKGETVSIAFVFPGEGIFPVNLFTKK
jgi:hypothetical protein